MTFTYVLTGDVGKIRTIIPDSNATVYNFEDEELEVFLALEGSIKKAAALALETIASNETMVLKVIKLLDITTDGAKVSDALLKRAALLRKQAGEDDAAAGGAFDVAEMVVDQFTYREKLRNTWLEGS